MRGSLILKLQFVLAALLFLAALLLIASSAQAQTTFTSRLAMGGDDTVDWGVLGPTAPILSGAPVSNPSPNVTSTRGSVVVNAVQSLGNPARLDEGANWHGDFSPGDHLLTTGSNTGPVTITFASGPVFGVGVQLQMQPLGPYIATLSAFDSTGALISTLTANGNSTSPTIADNSAPFLGIRAALPEIAKIEVSCLLSTSRGNLQEVCAMNQLSIATQAANIQDPTFFVQQLYRDLWNVTPDPVGTTTFVSQLNAGTATRAQVAQTFFNDPANLQTNGFYLSKLYIAMLGSDPDFVGWSFLMGQIQAGLATQNTVFQTFLLRPEFKALYGSLTLDTDFVTALYSHALNRAPDPGGFNYWLGQLAAGVPRSTVVQAFVNCPEADLQLHNRAEADLLYLVFLRRGADPGGLSWWTGVLDSGTPLVDVITAFISCPEYLLRF